MEEQLKKQSEEKKKKPGKKSVKIENKKAEFKRTLTKNEWEIISHPLMTEKSIGLIEKENKLVFIVSIKSNKTDIKYAIEKIFGAKVDTVTTSITRKGQKKAFVKLAKGFSAPEIATRLGML